MELFFVFQGDSYYPVGGARDFVGSFPTLEEAKASVKFDGRSDWRHIAALRDGKLVVVAHDGGGETCVGKGKWVWEEAAPPEKEKEAPSPVPAAKKDLNAMTRAELNDLLDDLMKVCDGRSQEILTERIGLILLAGKGNYRGTVTNLNTGMSVLAGLLRKAADEIDKGQPEW